MPLEQELSDLFDLNGGQISEQRRGQLFERWLRALLDQAGLRPRTSYRPKGEEIDGSFILSGRAFLLEAKWWKRPVPASAIYQFKGKVDGKLVGTIGVFVSMSDFAEDAVDSLRVGKVLNVILFNDGDIKAAISDGFSEVMEYKLRAAAEEGEIFTPYARRRHREEASRLMVVVEGRLDELVLTRFAKRLEDLASVRPLTVLTTLGRDGLISVAEAVAHSSSADILVVADADDAFYYDGGRRSDDVINGKVKILVVTGGVTRWLPARNDRRAGSWSPDEIVKAVRRVDVHELAMRDKAFAVFAGNLGVRFSGRLPRRSVDEADT